MSLITIQNSVGKNGVNLISDVAIIGAALVAVGVDRGGVFGPPLSIEGLAQAIQMFQNFQNLAVQDGKIDSNGSTLRRINEILNPNVIQPNPIPQQGSGTILPMRSFPEMKLEVDKAVWVSDEESLISDYVFRWKSAYGVGGIYYFELNENVVPKWFGILVPQDVNSFDKIHIFFHPTPSQAGYSDATYQGLGDWHKIFHYLTDDMAVQFCAASTGRVLVMPLMNQASAGSCGMLPKRWESLIGKMLGIIKTGTYSDDAPVENISSVVVSSFSAGISYSHHFCNNANLGNRLNGVIDFDGAFSSYKNLSSSLTNPYGAVIKMQQMYAAPQSLGTLAAQNVFPLQAPRWKGLFPDIVQGQVHGSIPQWMMYFAARRAE